MRIITKSGLAVGSATALMLAGMGVGGALADGGANTAPDTRGRTAAATTSAPRVFAVVKSDGTPGRGRGFATSMKTSTGIYSVRFERNIKRCMWQGTIGQGNFVGSSGPGEISITGLNGTKNGLYVTTFDSAGNAKDLPFLILVVCS